ncbi:MAG: ATP-binding protein, partial [Blastocatellia bacterium]
PQSTDMNKLMDEVVELASDRLERARTTVVRQFASNLQSGNFDPQQLRKVFLNLLINAVEASPQDSRVVLQTAFIPPVEAARFSDFNGQRGALQVSVVDFGSGMTEETKNRIFEAFYTTKRNGTGLGMMITQEIIKKHNGRIEIESEQGTGTKVSVYLPA